MLRRTAVEEPGRRASPGFLLLAAYAFVACVTAPVHGADPEDGATLSAQDETRMSNRVKELRLASCKGVAVPHKSSENRTATPRTPTRQKQEQSRSGMHEHVNDTGSCDLAASSCRGPQGSSETPLDGGLPTRVWLRGKRSTLQSHGDSGVRSEATHGEWIPENKPRTHSWTLASEHPGVFTTNMPVQTNSADSDNVRVHNCGRSTPEGSPLEDLPEGGQKEKGENTDVRSRQGAQPHPGLSGTSTSSSTKQKRGTISFVSSAMRQNSRQKRSSVAKEKRRSSSHLRFDSILKCLSTSADSQESPSTYCPSPLATGEEDSRSDAKRRVIQWFLNSRSSSEEQTSPCDRSPFSFVAATAQASAASDTDEQGSLCTDGAAQQKDAAASADESALFEGRDTSQLDSEIVEVRGSDLRRVPGAASEKHDCFGNVKCSEAEKKRTVSSTLQGTRSPIAPVSDDLVFGRQAQRPARVPICHADARTDTTTEGTTLSTLLKARDTFVPPRRPPAKTTGDEWCKRDALEQRLRQGISSSMTKPGGGAPVASEGSWDRLQGILTKKNRAFVSTTLQPGRRDGRHFPRKVKNSKGQPPRADACATFTPELQQVEKSHGDDGSPHKLVKSPPLTQHDEDCASSKSSDISLGAVRPKNKLGKRIPISLDTARTTTDNFGRSTPVDDGISECRSPVDKMSRCRRPDFPRKPSKHLGKQRPTFHCSGEANLGRLDTSASPGVLVREGELVVQPRSAQERRKAFREGQTKGWMGTVCNPDNAMGGLSRRFSVMPPEMHSTTGRTDDAHAGTVQSVPSSRMTPVSEEPWEGDEESVDNDRRAGPIETTAELTGAPDQAGPQDDLDLLREQEEVWKLFEGRLSFAHPEDDDVCSSEEAVGCLHRRGRRKSPRSLLRLFRWPVLTRWVPTRRGRQSSTSSDDDSSVGEVSTTSLFAVPPEQREATLKMKKKIVGGKIEVE